MRLLDHLEVDKKKYNGCIENAINRKIYAYSWWLDILHPGWKVLCWEDYKVVLPITEKGGWLFRRLAQPPFSQQLGVFSSHSDIHEYARQGWQFVHDHYTRGSMQWNDALAELAFEKKNVTLRANYQLVLTPDRRKNYRSNHRRLLEKAMKAKVEITDVPLKVFLDFFKKNNPKFRDDILPYWRPFIQLLEHLLYLKKGKILGVMSEGQLTSVVFWGVDHDTAYYLFPAVNDLGRSLGSNVWMIDRLERYIEKVHILDFEGSEVPGVQHFIKGFGAQLREYPLISLSRRLGQSHGQ